jgi:DNA-binding CsgD family transcriptional regulator
MSSAIFNIENCRIEVTGLPHRQAETLARTALGYSSKQTAKEMEISHRTVEMNLNMAMARYGARNRVHLVACAISEGVLTITRGTRAVTCCLICLLTLAIVPGASSPDDFNRLPARSVRVRRNREDLLTLVDTLEDAA